MLLGGPIFRFYVSFRECRPCTGTDLLVREYIWHMVHRCVFCFVFMKIHVLDSYKTN